MTEAVRITSVVMMTLLLILVSMFTLLWSINANNVQVATLCVQSGGDWTLISKKTDTGYRIERGCVHETGQ